MGAISAVLAVLGAAMVFLEDRAAELGLGAVGMDLLHVLTALCFLVAVAV
jgi:hypothetical protein